MLELNRIAPEECVELEVENKIRDYMFKVMRKCNRKTRLELDQIPVVAS
jgi:hypothetical protein